MAHNCCFSWARYSEIGEAKVETRGNSNSCFSLFELPVCFELVVSFSSAFFIRVIFRSSFLC